MTKEQLKSKIEELEKELAKFKKELDEKDKSPYRERAIAQPYYIVNARGMVARCEDYFSDFDRFRYENANYFSDESFAEKVAAEQTLTNLLRKYTYEHGWSDDLWNNEDCKCKIRYDHRDMCFEVDCNQFYESVNQIYFVDSKTAKNAIQEVVIPFVKEHPELGYELKD